MKIYFDVTKARSSRSMSGLVRVSRRLLDELRAIEGDELTAVRWSNRKRCLLNVQGSRPVMSSPDAHFVIPELFSELERPGFTRFLTSTPLRTLAVYHDAIPLKCPETTWPRSVQRHPAYLKALASFDRVLAVSDASREELGIERPHAQCI